MNEQLVVGSSNERSLLERLSRYADDEGGYPGEAMREAVARIESTQLLLNAALGAKNIALDDCDRLRAEVSTLREHLAEVNRLLSLNVAEIERLRHTHETFPAPSLLERITACLEPREPGWHSVHVIEGESETFWAALSDLFAARPSLKASDIPCAGVGSGYISQDRFENDDGSESEGEQP